MSRQPMLSPVASTRPVVGTRRQSGVVLLVALIALVAISLAAVALVRSVDTGLTIAGNTAFKESTTAASDVAVDVATDWLKTKTAKDLQTDSAGSGYYAFWRPGCKDMTGNNTPSKGDDVDWTGSATGSCGVKGVSVSGMPSGYTAFYVITRMCTCEGAVGANVCTVGAATNQTNVCAGLATAGAFHGIATYDYRGLTGAEASKVATGAPYFRVVTRVVGPRNTTSFVETVVTLE